MLRQTLSVQHFHDKVFFFLSLMTDMW